MSGNATTFDDYKINHGNILVFIEKRTGNAHPITGNLIANIEQDVDGKWILTIIHEGKKYIFSTKFDREEDALEHFNKIGALKLETQRVKFPPAAQDD